MIAFMVEEVKSSARQFGRAILYLSRWLFQVMIKLAVWGFFLSLFAGGGFIAWKLFDFGNEQPDSPVSNQLQQTRQQAQAFQYETGRNSAGELEERLRSGRSTLRSWRYTLQSVQRSIEEAFK